MSTSSHESPSPQPATATPIHFTAAAVDKIRQFLATVEQAQGKMLRVFVQGGGCSGFEYGFTFDVEQEGDIRMPHGDVDVIVDMFSLPYLEGSTIDYRDGLMGSGFTVTNPNAKGSCGCGHSFHA